VLCYIALCCTELYCAAFCFAALHCVALSYIALYCAALHCVTDDLSIMNHPTTTPLSVRPVHLQFFIPQVEAILASGLLKPGALIWVDDTPRNEEIWASVQNRFVYEFAVFLECFCGALRCVCGYFAVLLQCVYSAVRLMLLQLFCNTEQFV
jgi:hypothetical protein